MVTGSKKDYTFSFAMQDQFIVLDFIANVFNNIAEGDMIGKYKVIKHYKYYLLTCTPEGDLESFDAFDTMEILKGEKVGFVYGNRSM